MDASGPVPRTAPVHVDVLVADDHTGDPPAMTVFVALTSSDDT